MTLIEESRRFNTWTFISSMGYSGLFIVWILTMIDFAMIMNYFDFHSLNKMMRVEGLPVLRHFFLFRCRPQKDDPGAGDTVSQK